MPVVLVADDETRIRALVGDYLKKAGYDVIEAADGQAALDAFEQHPSVDVVVLDVMMPELDGWEVCRRLRRTSLVPVIMLTARAEEFDELTGFEAGADDYVTKPFSLTVLGKRIEAVLRRASSPHPEVSGDGLRIDLPAYVAYLDKKPLELTLKEFEILKKMYENAGRVYTRDQLLDAIWGFDYDGDARTVDSHVARLRLKLGDWGAAHLKTVYGLGYKIEP